MGAIDVSVLTIDVDSRSVTPAAVDLDKLTAAAGKTAPAIDAVGASSKKVTPAIVDLGGGAGQLGPALVTVTTAATTAGAEITKIGPALNTAGAAIDKITGSAEAAVTKITPLGPAVETVGRRSKTASVDLEALIASVNKATTSIDHLASSNAALAAKFDGIGPRIRKTGEEAGKAGEGVKKAGEEAGKAGGFFQRFGPQIQQAGYQVGDFAVQVASGGNAIVAFTQQGAQLAGMFGPAGAVAGAVLGIGGALVATLIPALIGSGDAASGAIGKFLAYTDGLDKARKGAEDLAKAIGGLSDAQLKQQIAEVQAGRKKDAEGTKTFVRGYGMVTVGPNGIRGAGQAAEVDPEKVALEVKLREEQEARARAERRLGPAPGDEGRPTAESRREDARLRAARAAGADPFAAQRKSQSLYPPSSGDQTGYQSELNQREVAEANKRESEAKATQSRLASEAKARADHAKTIAKSLEDMTVAANDNAAALTKQEAALKGGITNSVQLEAAQKAARATQDQVQIETTLRRFRGDATAEQIQGARAALQAQAEANRALEDQTKLVQDQVQWERQLAQAKRDRADVDRQKLQDLQNQTAGMQLDEQRQKVEENRQAFKAYGQVAFDALGQIAIGGEKASAALSNLLKTWANMAFQAASQRLLQALATALFPQATGTAAAFGAAGGIGGGDVYAHQAAGGDSQPGRTYIVGEHGRERFTPWTKGRVEPMSKGSSGQTIAVNTTNNIQLSGSATDEDAQRMARAIDRKMNQTIDDRLARHARAGGAFAA